MPIPFLVVGLGVAAGVIGAGSHLSANDTNEKAQKVSQDAKELYDSAKDSLEKAKSKAEKSLLKLGYSKKEVLGTSMKRFLKQYEKIKNLEFENSVGLRELSNFSITQEDAIQLQKMSNIYSSTISSGATGAAAGAIVALAASGNLAIVTSGLSAAGTALAAGEIGAAASIAGSALSLGASLTPIAAIAAPVVLFTGISASIKADENLEKAKVMYAEAEAASEKMKTSELLCNAISKRSEMFYDTLEQLNNMFSHCTSILEVIIRKKEQRRFIIFRRKLKEESFSADELDLIAVTRALAGAIKAIIDTPILNKNGEIETESITKYNKTVEIIPEIMNTVNSIQILKTV